MKIFISYAHVDLPRVQQLADSLLTIRHDVWFDQQLTGGQSWKEQLYAQIQESECFLYALTPASVTSQWCQWEFAQAVHMGKKIVTVLLQKCKINGALAEHHYIDFTQGDTLKVGLQLGAAVLAAKTIPKEKVPLLPDPDDIPPEREVAHTDSLVGNETARRLYDGAFQFYLTDQYEKARKLLRDALEVAPDYTEALSLLKLAEGKLVEQLSSKLIHEISPVEVMEPLPSILPAPFEWIEIPGGPFLMGSDEDQDPDARGNELPQISVDVPTFYIAKYPVTYAQYEVFVDGDGYTNDAYWTAAGREWRGNKRHPTRYWQDEKWHMADHPVVGVTWYEAYAFTQWLGAALTPGLSSSGRGEWGVRLPSEVEWEKASRGTDGRIYPWGSQPPTDELCNFGRNVGKTTPVTHYPQGASRYGVIDMGGNVWEWCMTKAPGGKLWRYADGPEAMDNTPESDAIRVRRGGSWSLAEYSARCAYRYLNDYPYYWLNYVGFRVVCGRPPSL